MTKEELKIYANKLMFDMSNQEYETLLNEFDILLKKMETLSFTRKTRILRVKPSISYIP